MDEILTELEFYDDQDFTVPYDGTDLWIQSFIEFCAPDNIDFDKYDDWNLRKLIKRYYKYGVK